MVTELLAYTTLIRLKLEHATLVCNPHQKYLIDSLELVQNRATGFILKTYSLVSVTQVKYFVGSLALNQRRQDNISPPTRIIPQHDHPNNAHIPFAKSNLLKFSPFALAMIDR